MASALVVVLLLLGLTTLAYGGSQTSPNLAVNPTCSLPFSTGWSTGWNWGCNAGAFYPYNEASDSSAWQYVDIGMYRNFISSGTAQGIFSVNLQTGSGGDKGSTYLYFMDANKNSIMSYSKLNQVSVGSYAPQIIQAVIPSNARYAYIQMTCNKLSISSACVSYWTSASLTVTFTTPNSVDVVTGLSGARGSSFRSASNTLYFVEATRGTLSSYSLIRAKDTTYVTNAATVSSGQSLNLITGVSDPNSGHVRLDNYDYIAGAYTGPLNMRPTGNNRICLLGNNVNINSAALQSLTYDLEYIPIELLQPTFVFAVMNTYKQAAANFDYSLLTVTASTATTVTLQVVTYVFVPAYQVLGYNYLSPQDVKVTSDGTTAYITEGSGYIQKVNLLAANKNRTGAVTLASGLASPRELQLDEAHHQAYVVEFGYPGTLSTIDLISGTKNVILSNVYYASGLLIDSTASNAWVSEIQGGYYIVSKIDLQSKAKTTYSSHFNSIYNLAWGDASQSTILATENYANQIHQLNIAKSPSTSALIFAGTAPYSIGMVAPGNLLIVEDDRIVQNFVLDPNFNSLGPLLLGIGNVPASAITGGYATTSSSSMYYVKNSPFGGRLPVMVNHEKARMLNALSYQVLYDGIPQTASWNDMKWDPNANKAVVVTMTADSFGRFPVRQAGELWSTPWLGYFMDTNLYSDNALHNITIQLYYVNTLAVPNGSGSVIVFVDNNAPTAAIRGIYHTFDNGTTGLVSPCDIIQGLSDSFSFLIDASDSIGKNLLSWSLVGYWGDNKSGLVASDTYSNHDSAVQWTVPSSMTTPVWHATVPNDATSRKCAHTFFLDVWDRAIDGFNYIHHSTYSVSLTFFLK